MAAADPRPGAPAKDPFTSGRIPVADVLISGVSLPVGTQEGSVEGRGQMPRHETRKRRSAGATLIGLVRRNFDDTGTIVMKSYVGQLNALGQEGRLEIFRLLVRAGPQGGASTRFADGSGCQAQRSRIIAWPD